MRTIDAVRELAPIGDAETTADRVRRATLEDTEALTELDREHVRHYVGAPVFMAPPEAMDGRSWSAFLDRPPNTAWIAENDDGPVAFLRADHEFGGSDVIADEGGGFITGAFVRPAYRRTGMSAALLGAAFAHYAHLGARFLAVDFESFNPEARGFWLRYFRPVCTSVMCVPEVVTSSM